MQVIDAVHRQAREAHDQVTRLKAGLRRRPALLHRLDAHRPRIVELDVGRDAPPRRITAMSVSGSSPTRSASRLVPSAKVAWMRRAPCTTWLFVSSSPSGVKANAEPLPARRSNATCRCATAGATASTAATTAAE